ncbi:ankyrin repeat domain-containing protein [Candidatus Babeliales bacterium]|nr:ankyrin repeat domain-containing protein [Candidatus Babeliales bacterium]
MNKCNKIVKQVLFVVALFWSNLVLLSTLHGAAINHNDFKIHEYCWDSSKDLGFIKAYVESLSLSNNDLADYLNKRDFRRYSALDYAIMRVREYPTEAKNADLDVVLFLISRGADPLPCFITALTPWFRKEVAELLSPMCFFSAYLYTDYQGISLIHRIAQFNRDGDSLRFIVKELEKYGISSYVSFNMACRGSELTPLHFAASQGMLCNVFTLIENGAEVNARDSQGNTPLHLAAKNGLAYIVRPLIMKGALTFAVNDFGQTPMSLAKINDHQKVVDILDKQSSSNTCQDNSVFDGDANATPQKPKRPRANGFTTSSSNLESLLQSLEAEKMGSQPEQSEQPKTDERDAMLAALLGGLSI